MLKIVYRLVCLFSAVLILPLCENAAASPWLTCNPYPAVATGGDPKTAIASFSIFIDGATVGINSLAEIKPDGTQVMAFDLGSQTPSTHTVTATAVDGYGVQSQQAVPLSFTLAAPSAPGGLKIQLTQP